MSTAFTDPLSLKELIRNKLKARIYCLTLIKENIVEHIEIHGGKKEKFSLEPCILAQYLNNPSQKKNPNHIAKTNK